MSIFGGLFGGNEQPQEQRFQKFTPEQQQALNQILQMGLGGVQEGGAGFAPIAQKARTQFEQQTIPTIAERFAGSGGLSSGAFQRALGQAGAGLEEGLAAQEGQYNLQRQGQLQNLLGMGLQSRFDTHLPQQEPGLFQSLLQAGGTALPLLLGGAFGGGFGGGLGQLLGGAAGSVLGQLGGGQGNTGSVGRQFQPRDIFSMTGAMKANQLGGTR